ncbi:hypothetical protein [Streptomyces phytohabitans]|uniref:hypothetical protein n=1 Tax=Streptomyces phytohabitans TaxID=1150371 RepID=UPI00345B6EB7
MNLLAVSQSGFRKEYVTLSVTGGAELTLSRPGVPSEVHAGVSLFGCLLGVRETLEAEGLLLCCQGARPDVTTSGMQSQMPDSRHAYTFDLESRTVNTEMVDILAPAPFSSVATISEQRAAIFALFNVRKEVDGK